MMMAEQSIKGTKKKRKLLYSSTIKKIDLKYRWCLIMQKNKWFPTNSIVGNELN